MNPIEHPADCDVQKIKAKIRDARFTVHAFRPWLKWGGLVGCVVGLLLATWVWSLGYLPWQTRGFSDSLIRNR